MEYPLKLEQRGESNIWWNSSCALENTQKNKEIAQKQCKKDAKTSIKKIP